MRKCLVHAGPSGGGGSCFVSTLPASPLSTGSAIATCPDLVAPSTAALVVAVSSVMICLGAFTGLMDRCQMLSKKMSGGIGPRVDPMFASPSTFVLFALVT